MATGWIKSLQCKSKALDDVVSYTHHPNTDHHHRRHRRRRAQPSCSNSYQSLKDVVEKEKPKPKPHHPSPPFRRPVSRKPESGPDLHPPIAARPGSSELVFPSLMELPRDHPSRNVVEIIFHTSWGEESFPGRIEIVFKVQNLTRTLNRFEEYREAVKLKHGGGGGGGEDNARCTADGNEVMRFYSLGAGGTCDAGGGAWAFHHGCKGAAVCTYSGSGVAHEHAGGGGGRRTMLVCRVIAGRVWKRVGFESLARERVGYDSVSGEKGELFVFDTRALLPCFLIIYKL